MAKVIFLPPRSLSDKCVCSLVSRATLNQEEVEHRQEKQFGGAPDKESTCLTLLFLCFLQAGLRMKGDLAVRIADLMGITH